MLRILLPVLLTYAFSATSQTATEIVQKAEEKFRGSTSIVALKMEIIRPTWKRTLELKAWMKGDDYALLLITAPVKEKGIVYLKRKNEVWNWIPALERNIKLPPSMMSESWMGTDFTNDDLVKESSTLVDYSHRFMADTVVDGRSCYQILMTPKKEASVVWGCVTLCIDKKDLLELYSRFYDEDNYLVHTVHAYDYRTMDGRLLPTRFELIPTEKPGHKTVMIYQSVLFNRPMEEGFFTTQNMSNIR